MIRFKTALLLLAVSVGVVAEEQPSMEFLLFLAEYTDEQGNWNAPDLEQPSADGQPQQRGEVDE